MLCRKNNIIDRKRAILLLALVVICFGMIHPVYPQEIDSLSNLSSGEADIYKIKFTRVQRAIWSSLQGQSEESSPQAILTLLKDAKELAGEQEYEVASQYLDMILVMLDPALVQVHDTLETNGNGARPQWNLEAFTGMELWQQKFGIVLDNRDSVIYEDQYNPLIGFRIQMQSGTQTTSFTQFQLDGRTSRDYDSGSMFFRHSRKMFSRLTAFINNQFEATSYRQYSDLRYIANRTRVGGELPLSRQIRLEIEDEMEVRNYRNESEFFPSFFQNQIKSKLYLDLRSVRFQFYQYYRHRNHKNEPGRNYAEQFFNLSLWSFASSSSNITAQAQYMRREYPNGSPSNFLTNDFNQYRLEISWRNTWSKNSELRLDFDLESLNFRESSSISPNHLDIIFEPSVAVEIGLPWTTRLGYRLRNKTHYSSQDSGSESVDVEDYKAYGPILALEWLHSGNFIATISNSLEFRRFPNAPSSNPYSLPFYSNRNIYSMMLFLSWHISSHWEISATGNIDLDRDQDITGADSRSNFINFELSYKF